MESGEEGRPRRAVESKFREGIARELRSEATKKVSRFSDFSSKSNHLCHPAAPASPVVHARHGYAGFGKNDVDLAPTTAYSAWECGARDSGAQNQAVPQR